MEYTVNSTWTPPSPLARSPINSSSTRHGRHLNATPHGGGYSAGRFPNVTRSGRCRRVVYVELPGSSDKHYNSRHGDARGRHAGLPHFQALHQLTTASGTRRPSHLLGLRLPDWPNTAMAGIGSATTPRTSWTTEDDFCMYKFPPGSPRADSMWRPTARASRRDARSDSPTRERLCRRSLSSEG